MLKGKCWVKVTVAWKTMTCSFLRSLKDVVDVRHRPCIEETVSHLYDTVKSFQISDENFPSVRVVTRSWNFFNVTFYLNFYCAIPEGLEGKKKCFALMTFGLADEEVHLSRSLLFFPLSPAEPSSCKVDMAGGEDKSMHQHFFDAQPVSP